VLFEFFHATGPENPGSVNNGVMLISSNIRYLVPDTIPVGLNVSGFITASTVPLPAIIVFPGTVSGSMFYRMAKSSLGSKLI
jgi:hypothetical protein